MDPQERLFLQSVWAALEDAGLTRDELRRRYPKGKSADVGVFVGVTSNTYQLLGAQRWEHGLDSARSGSGLMDPTLSSLPWSIANRVSYVFDLQGPSLPVDTACSSSLVAIHLACESLRRAECRVAVAGGVNLYLHPAKYHGLCQRRMLAEHGRCRSYGAGDDGFVPGEGIGSLILKTLSQAIHDGDRIHGLIRASGYDHSGRSNGYSAPNPGAQVALIGDVLRRADIKADTISYVEGHGTGTQLGDSLEVRAMSQALGSGAAQSCVLGSIKANIGHTESAAGVLGVTKVLLQMRHRQIAPSIHAEPANPDIDFERTPFRILKQAEAWDVASGQPRRAMINAFGAGGVNACLVLEEYLPVETAIPPERMPAEVLFVLSASSQDRLRDYAEAWVARLRRESASLALAEIARLLQIGREQMTERVAVVASNPTELAERLEAWLKGEASSVYLGGKGADCTDDTVFRQDDRMLKALVQAQDLHGIGRAWAAGSDVPWRQLSSVANHPSGMFPTYPFARTRYWPSAAPARAAADSLPGRALQLHPLISHNASNLWETCYTSILSRDAFYAQHHRVHREPLLPGSAWLEIARASGSFATMSEVRRLRDVVFVRPLAFNDPVQAAVTTLRIDGGELLFTIASHDPAQGPVVHCEGVLECGKTPLGSGAEWEMPIASLIQQSTRRIASEDCYARFERSGIDYGPTFRTIQVLHAGEGFVLARLSLSPCGEDDEFGLHPCLIDGALQTISGFAGDESAAAGSAFIPFAIDEIAIHGAVPMDCFAHAVESVRSVSARDGIRKFDIDIATEEGVVVVSLKGLSVRSLKPQPSSAITHSSTHAA
jgi:polyketide synthase PksN